jgi:hypothetical protein
MDPQMGQTRFPSTPKNAVHITSFLTNKHNLTHQQKFSLSTPIRLVDGLD